MSTKTNKGKLGVRMLRTFVNEHTPIYGCITINLVPPTPCPLDNSDLDDSVEFHAFLSQIIICSIYCPVSRHLWVLV